MSITAMRNVLTAAGATPVSNNQRDLIREMIVKAGGTPTQWANVPLLRELITALGGTPTQWSELGLLKELVTKTGGSAASFDPDKLWTQVVLAPAFSPASLFTGGVAGAWYDPSDLSSMWQDSAGTTPAAVDSPVGKVNDKSGNGQHLTQATSAARPMLRSSGGLYWLEFDGVDDKLTGTVTGLGGTGTNKTLFAALKMTSVVTSATHIVLGAAGGCFGQYVDGTSRRSVVHWGAEPFGSAATTNKEVWTAIMSGSNSSLRVNGSVDIAPTNNASVNISSTAFTIGVADFGNAPNILFYGGLIVAGNPSPTNMEAFLAAKAGL